ncbi:MAG TPA: hypothetical protein VF718_15430 [Allosphingosinicella sp.]|jgi:hypothetical protein
MESRNPKIRELRSPLAARDLKPLEPEVRVVQFREPLQDSEYRAVRDLLSGHPQVNLRAYGDYSKRFLDLDFLRHFGGIQGLQIDLPYLEDAGGLAAVLGGLQRFSWGSTDRRFSLDLLSQAPGLRDLHLEKHSRGIDIVGTLRGLRRLSLRSIALNDLEPFASLPELRKLEIRLGRLDSISAAAAMARLQYLELWMVRGVSDLEVLSELGSLEYLRLQSLKHVAELPSLRSLTRLRRVVLEDMKGLRDLRPVAEAPNLEELLVINMPHLPTDCLAPFAGHPALKVASAGLGSLLRNAEARSVLPGIGREVTLAPFSFSPG